MVYSLERGKSLESRRIDSASMPQVRSMLKTVSLLLSLSLLGDLPLLWLAGMPHGFDPDSRLMLCWQMTDEVYRRWRSHRWGEGCRSANKTCKGKRQGRKSNIIVLQGEEKTFIASVLLCLDMLWKFSNRRRHVTMIELALMSVGSSKHSSVIRTATDLSRTLTDIQSSRFLAGTTSSTTCHHLAPKQHLFGT